MVNVQRLRGKIVERNFTQKQLASLVNISPSALNRKLKTGNDFSLEEANDIVVVLELTREEATEIFFA